MFFRKKRKWQGGGRGSAMHHGGPISFGKDLLASGMVAAISKMVAPAERVKLLLQVQASSKRMRADQRSEGTADCFVRIPRERGFFSFWRGNLANVRWYFPTQALNFAFKDKYKQIFMSKVHDEKQIVKCKGTSVKRRQAISVCQTLGIEENPKSLRVVTRGTWKQMKNLQIQKVEFFNFVTACVVTTWLGMMSYPFDTVRRRMMMQSRETERQCKGTVNCFTKIHEREGLHAFFRGAFPNILHGTGGALVLVLYDKITGIFNLKISESSGSD